MEGKGVGRVVEVNLGLESFKVDFERHKGVTVGFRAAAKLLEPLAPGTCCGASSKTRAAVECATAADRAAAGRPPELRPAADRRRDPRHARRRRLRSAVDLLVGGGAQAPAGRDDRRRRQTYRWAATRRRRPGVDLEGFERADPRGKIDACGAKARATPSLRERMAARARRHRRAGDGRRSRPRLRDLVRPRAQPAALAERTSTGRPTTCSPDRARGRCFSGIEDRLLRERAYAMAARAARGLARRSSRRA